MNANTHAAPVAGSIEVADEGMAGKFQEFLDANHPRLLITDAETLLMKEAFYYGAQALLDAASPISKLQEEIAAYLDDTEEGTEE